MRLGHARLEKTRHPHKPVPGDFACLADQRDFRLGLHRAQPMQKPREPMISMKRITFPALPHEPRLAGFHHDGRARVFVRVQVDIFAFAHERVQNAVEIAQPFHPLNPRDPDRFLAGQLAAFPGFEVRDRFPQKKDFTVALVLGIREEKHDAFLLLDAGQVKEIRVRLKNQRAVGIGRKHIVVVDDGERRRLHQFTQAAAVFDKELGINRGVAHEEWWFASVVNGAKSGGKPPMGRYFLWGTVGFAAIPSWMIFRTASRSAPINGRRGARVHSRPSPHS